MKRRVLELDQLLPLTCTRSGTCCHGKDIRLTPWELACLAHARAVPVSVFRDQQTTDGGARLACNGPPGWRGLPTCSQYDPQRGCIAHGGRPLACRLYPLGREREGAVVRIIHEGRAFPCHDGCPEVTALPSLSVRTYLAQQGVEPFAAVRDAYLEMAQDLAEGAFVLVFDSGLARSGGGDWRRTWQQVVDGGAASWVATLGPDWHDRITVPALAAPLDDGPAWVQGRRERA